MFKQSRPQIVLLDLMMPGVRGLEMLERILEADPGADVILMTGHYSTESAVEAIKKGASDYLNKPLNVETLQRRIAALLSDAGNRRKTHQLEHELLDACQFEGLVGRSPLMLDVFVKIKRVAPHFRTALITGATGTGKELVARALHHLSPAPSGPFVVCNCAAIVETLVESELFGYVRGAFTGAIQDKLGVFEYANRGTVFLDEIGELPLPAQAKLLRVLQSNEIQGIHSWPGNIRELENVIGNACMMVDGSVIDIGDLPELLRGTPGSIVRQEDDLISLEASQRRHVMRVLERVNGNKARAAEILGISRSTIYQFLAQPKVEKES
jgi:DNA-binding NtrC family response regulator